MVSILSVCVFRSLYVATTALFISYAFPTAHFGKLYGVTRVIGGLFTMLSVPIFEAVQAQGNAFKDANFDFAVVIGKCLLN